VEKPLTEAYALMDSSQNVTATVSSVGSSDTEDEADMAGRVECATKHELNSSCWQIKNNSILRRGK